MIFSQNRKDGRSNLSPHQMNMGDVRTLVLYQFLHLLCCLEVIEIVHHILHLLQRSLARFLRLREILAIWRRIILWPFQREIHYLMAVLLQQFARIKANGLCSTFIEIVDVD